MNESVGFEGIGELVMTFYKYGTIGVGDLVSMKSNHMVQKASVDEEVTGVCVYERENYVGIQVKGGVTVACTDTGLALGYRPLKAAANNSVKLSATGAPHLVVAVDSTARTATVIL